jgi:WD40 repeat protein
MRLKKAFLLAFLLQFNFNSFTQEPRLILPIGHTDYVNIASFSPDGKMLLTASEDKTVKIWEVASGLLLLNFTAHNEEVKTASFSPDGKSVLSLDDGNVAKLWQVNGTVVIDSVNTSERVHFTAFMPDNKNLLIADGDSVFIKEINTHKIVSRFFTGFQYEYVLSPDSKLLATRYKEGYQVWDLQRGELLKKLAVRSILDQFSFIAGNKAMLLWQPGRQASIHPLTDNDRSLDKTVSLLSNLGNIALLSMDQEHNKMAVLTAGDELFTINIQQGEKQLVLLSAKKNSLTSLHLAYDGSYLFTTREETNEVGMILAETWQLKEKGKPVKVSMARLPGFYLDIDNFAVSRNSKNFLLGTKDPKDIYLLDAISGTIKTSLGGSCNEYYSADFNPAGDKILTASFPRQITWNFKMGKPESLIGRNFAREARYSPSGDYVLMNYGSAVSLLSLKDPSVKKTIKCNKKDVSIDKVVFTADGKRVLFVDTEKEAVVWDIQSGKIISESGILRKDIRSSGIADDGKEAVAVTNDSLIIFETDSWEIKRLFTYKSNFGRRFDPFWDAGYSPDGKKILASTFKGNLMLINPRSGLTEDSLKGDGEWLKFFEMSPDGKKLLAVTKSQQLMLGDWATHSNKIIPGAHEGEIKTARFSKDSKYFVTASTDNTCKIWNASEGSLMATFFSVDTADYFVSLPGGYYQASSAATKLLHYVTNKLETISFSQLDVKYNRPDKVLEAIGNTDTALIKSYRKAWEKRIKKLGIDTTAFRDGYSVPECDFMNRDALEYEQKNETLSLHIKGYDSTYLLDRFNVWVNESPLFGQRGISLKNKNNNSIDTTITVKLSQGENRIECSITNVNGTESYRMPLYVNYTPAVKQKESVRFIGIGIDRFKESQHNLQYSSKDIRDLAVKLKEKYKDNIIIDTLFNEHVTTEKVKALKQKLQQTSVNDKVILSYSGHGLLSKDYDYYLSTYSVNFSKPEENGLPYDELESLLDSIPARKKLMLIDACHSGEVDKEEGIAMNKLADSLGLSKGIIIDQPQQQQHVGLKNSFELMQSLFVNVGKSTGATIISAAAGNQFALERGDLKNGVFTYSLLEAMNNNPTIKISELKKIVRERVEQLTNGLQKPTCRNENIAVDWIL